MEIFTLHTNLVINMFTSCHAAEKQQTSKQLVFFAPSNASLWPQLAVTAD